MTVGHVAARVAPLTARVRAAYSPHPQIEYQRGRGGVQADRSRVSSVLRRFVDVAVSAPALVLLSPLLLAIAILVRLDSPGPILFRQMRIGRDRRDRTRGGRSRDERRGAVLYGKPFAILKFRTMCADARERFPELYLYTYSQEELRTIPIKVLVGNKDDPSAKRNPAVRELLVDRIADNIRYYTQEELEILEVRPGVTGLAQIMGRGLLTFRETNSYDLEYVRNRSLALDLKIFLKTINALLRRDGAS
jgi:lipopolysaccharide/colanic/teichoic acid biosynthesis glycosyltransferase